MKIVSFHEPIADEKLLVELWTKVWRKFDFDPVVIGLDSAKQYPKYEEYLSRVRSYPTVNGPGFDELCLLRWPAVEMYSKEGERIAFTDYDVFPLAKIPKIPDVFDGLIFNGDQCGGPGFIVGENKDWRRITKMMFEYEVVESDKFGGIPHVSDMTILHRNKHEFHCRDWVRCYGITDWELKPMTHFGNCFRKRRDIPKHEEALQILNEFYSI